MRTRAPIRISRSPNPFVPGSWEPGRFDANAVDGVVRGTGLALADLSSRLRRVQNGFVRSYALTMLIGVVAILGAVWVMQ